ncbi:uncharacterized protein LAJ45_09732 [Morchella importuna]|uniref:Secreted protein n=1 Tax=Morchella conica CCBAS932 TaxID=1392247 RepID=A0A3N4KIP7_9PEZI|nr:uncharacterized protein LAJ45_09732 [Morchella importuna]KAH8146289.1 hypothetical protein LAJ45_09732 [Morchella importuna]RPB09278.1 hypothetical protein P167DRAFT_548171 [Morchella conica CCBAS932]
MFKLLPLLILAILLSFTGPAAAIVGNVICETSNGSPYTSWLMYVVNVGPRGPGLCIQDNPDVNGRPGCTLCVNHGKGYLKISICGRRGSQYTYADIQESLKKLVGECTRTFAGNGKTGGKFVGQGGQATIFVHL